MGSCSRPSGQFSGVAPIPSRVPDERSPLSASRRYFVVTLPPPCSAGALKGKLCGQPERRPVLGSYPMPHGQSISRRDHKREVHESVEVTPSQGL